ncbi:MAG: N-(5'-phosphoribosyl)anthranilate isomerase, partial [Betaproteobacteria bacterium]
MHAQTKVKVCGFTKPDNAGEVALLGVNAIGLVFAEQSARFVSVDVASAIARSIPPFVSVVALFVDPSQRQVSEVISRVRPDLLQFHGAESSEFCNQFS